MVGECRVNVFPYRHGPGRHPRMDVDRYVSLRLRERRAMLGLTQQQMAALIGVTCQQAHKYETGINRISPAGCTSWRKPWRSRWPTSLLARTPERFPNHHDTSACCWSWRAASWR